ncbi:TPA: AAC(3) family N-acetyltransferase [Campylobacter lari]|uniref:AAC(3) family N-acetyltransferase n=1 Tax=Campylobacter lari TaxID=201 RepID=UPI0017D0DA96|nr:AAC(3) family N-acetyltransferase [Campylobacter lari]EAI4828556.1 aminoglycoside N(3)-acetyltransferase [Campylobacter lari]EAI7268985.1 aminoglycoside N(3)-acetyltransferase [Campylobacter lari]MCV3368152.1 AAC(3) family N-acetyltransferase [Campylobacter lari]MCW0187085.1 AAC(3) family N-acetyltransferase [Campylobacter lari]MCW0231247.1 AAC(3) family N-acetyltransferase [Campylobacter lari]
MQALFKHNDKIFYKHDLIQALKKLGIKKGDIICIHSEIYNLGIPLADNKILLQQILESFEEVVGSDGTIIMPTFTYSFCNKEIYDKVNSITKIGTLNEFFRKQKDVKRTNDPIFSFAIKGAKEELFLKDTESCFGVNSVYDILTKNAGKLIFFGNWELEGMTYFHYLEELAQVSYRYYKLFSGKIADENGMVKEWNINFYCRNTKKNSIASLKIVLNLLSCKNKINIIKYAGATISLMNIIDIYKECLKKLKDDETFFLEKK